MKTTTLLTTCAIFAITASALADTRDFTNSAGKTITAELVKVDGENAILSINGKEYPVPANSLSTDDQAYIQEWHTAQQAAAEEAKAAAEAKRSQLVKALEGELVLLDGRKLEEFKFEDESKLEYMAFYSSASWCGPCQAFSPTLTRDYKSLKRKYDNFELVLLSADRSEGEWEAYVKDHKMPFPALKFSSSAKGAAQRGKNSNFIPGIHVIRLSDGAVVEDASAGAAASLENFKDILKGSQG